MLPAVGTPIRNSCIVVFNPIGVVNTDALLSQGVGGYHDNVVVRQASRPHQQFIPAPYCFINVTGPSLTVADRGDEFADSISYEVAEMTVDPYDSYTNPEVCDACAGNCGKNWRSFFSSSSVGGFNYLGSVSGIPPLTFHYDFFTAAIAQTAYPDSWPQIDRVHTQRVQSALNGLWRLTESSKNVRRIRSRF